MEDQLREPLPEPGTPNISKRALIRAKAAERRDFVRKYLNTAGSYNVPAKAIAEKFGCALGAVYDDIHFILEETPLPTVKRECSKLIMSFQHVLMKAHKLLSSANNPKDEREAIKVLLEALSKYTEFLEAWGLKERAPELFKLQVDVRQTSTLLVLQQLEKVEREGRTILTYDDVTGSSPSSVLLENNISAELS